MYIKSHHGTTVAFRLSVNICQCDTAVTLLYMEVLRLLSWISVINICMCKQLEVYTSFRTGFLKVCPLSFGMAEVTWSNVIQQLRSTQSKREVGLGVSQHLHNLKCKCALFLFAVQVFLWAKRFQQVSGWRLKMTPKFICSWLLWVVLVFLVQIKTCTTGRQCVIFVVGWHSGNERVVKKLLKAALRYFLKVIWGLGCFIAVIARQCAEQPHVFQWLNEWVAFRNSGNADTVYYILRCYR